MKTLIIEDEAPAAARLKGMLELLEPSTEILSICNSVQSSVKWLKNNPAPELIMMDIELADGRSFEIFEKVTITSPIIFTTAYDQFAIKAIKLHALDYLMKPVNKKELAEALQKAKNKVNIASTELSELQQIIAGMSAGKRPKKLAISTVDSTQFVELDKIIRLEADSNYTHIFVNGGQMITVSRTLKEYEDLLSGFGFFRVHKAHIINLSFIDKLLKGDGGSVLMTDGKAIEISPLKKKELMTALSIR
ncbi:MAG TPA: LytTR family DNA-binding domain-containing protein [Bacteroidia bacterium]|jgi:two-component system LytT family response regulator|nr:LytTR family DNA-binding domain-containing protein [Bacteroidia bacterium]